MFDVRCKKKYGTAREAAGTSFNIGLGFNYFSFPLYWEMLLIGVIFQTNYGKLLYVFSIPNI